MAYYDFVAQEPVTPPTPSIRVRHFAGPANDHNILYTGSGTVYQYISGSLVPTYATGNGTTTLTFTKACTLNIFLASGRLAAEGTSSITAVKNGSSILTVSNRYEPYYNASSVSVNMAVGNTLRIYAQGSDTYYAVHTFAISIVDQV